MLIKPNTLFQLCDPIPCSPRRSRAQYLTPIMSGSTASRLFWARTEIDRIWTAQNLIVIRVYVCCWLAVIYISLNSHYEALTINCWNSVQIHLDSRKIQTFVMSNKFSLPYRQKSSFVRMPEYYSIKHCMLYLVRLKVTFDWNETSGSFEITR